MPGDNPLYELGNLANLAEMTGFQDFQDQSGGVDPGFDQNLEDFAAPASDYQLSGMPEQHPDIMGGDLRAPQVAMPGDVMPRSVKSIGGGESRGMGVSASGRGFSEKKAAQIDKRDIPLQRDLAAADAQAASMQQPGIDALGAAKESATVAAQGLADAQVEKITGEALAAKRLAEVHNQFALAEEEINAHYTSKQNQAQMDYVASLADFRASRVDPAQFWKSMSGGEKFGTVVAAFIHGFLGAKGIKTTVMDSLDKAIDRNIAAQEFAIKNKGEVTQGFKQLWEMQRAQSASDAEARTRVRGFMLESVKQGITANMAQYEAGLATAQGQAALAKIDEAYAQNLVEVYKEIAKNTAQLRGQAIQWNGDKLKAANEAWANSIRQQEANQRRTEYDDLKKEKERLQIAKMKGNAILDPESNSFKWTFKEGVSDKAKERTNEAIEGAAEVNREIAELRKLAAEAGSQPDFFTGSRLMGEPARKAEAIRLRLAHAMVKANGERATEQDVKQYLKSLPVETWFTNGGVDTIIAYAQKNALDKARTQVQLYTDELKEPVPQHESRPFEGAYRDAESAASGRKPADTPVSEANKALGHEGGDEEASDEQIKKVRDLTKVEPVARVKEFRKTIKETPDEKFMREDYKRRYAVEPPSARPTAGEIAVAGLGSEAREGKHKEKALKQLEYWAGLPGKAGEMAQWELQQIREEKNPQTKPKNKHESPQFKDYELAKQAGIIGE